MKTDTVTDTVGCIKAAEAHVKELLRQAAGPRYRIARASLKEALRSLELAQKQVYEGYTHSGS